MDPIAVTAGTALIGAIATDAWQQVREAVTRLWIRARREHEENVGAELDDLRQQVLLARRDGDAGTERALEAVWQLKLQELLRSDPTLATELKRVLDGVLAPALAGSAQVRTGTIIMTGSSHDSSTFTQVGTQINFPGQ